MVNARNNTRDRFLRTAFDITAAEWDTILAFQQGRCPICGRSISGRPRPHTDHDHDTGDLRGLLCGQCNRALGKAQDKRFAWSPVCFLRAFLYLIRYPAFAALGRQPVGFPGRVGTKRYREWARKKADPIRKTIRRSK